MRLKDVDALIESLSPDPVLCPGCPEPENLGEFVQWLDAAPTVDAIPRESAIRTAEVMRERCDTGSLDDYRDLMVNTLEMLPPPSQRVATLSTRWIPCSVRLPDDTGESVYVTVLDESGDYPFRYVAQGWAIPGHPNEWVVDGEYRLDVVAWMPNPRPWKGEE